MTDKYLLVDGEPVPEHDLNTWGKWMEKPDRLLWSTRISTKMNDENLTDYRVSTVFLGLDHRFSCEAGMPVLFETMIFGEEYKDAGEYQHRCCTYAEALEMHREACLHVFYDKQKLKILEDKSDE